jgi:hypothetical protein
MPNETVGRVHYLFDIIKASIQDHAGQLRFRLSPRRAANGPELLLLDASAPTLIAALRPAGS